jgi:alpha-L-fucosidase 2
MKTTRRRFLKATAVTATAKVLPGSDLALPPTAGLDAFQIAKRHRINRDLPTPNFFEGMLLGNGDVGVCVTVRPDALGLHLGKEDSWDIRVSEDHYKYVLPFDELLKLWERASEVAKRQGKPDMVYLETHIDFLREYTQKVAASYGKSWPRPWPCGVVWIHWDSRMVTVRRQSLDPSIGVYSLDLLYDNLRGSRREITVTSFVNQYTGHISINCDEPTPFVSVAYYPNLDDSAHLPPPDIDASVSGDFAEFSCYQHFPAIAPLEENPNPPHSDRDRNFALSGRVSGQWKVVGLAESQEELKRKGIGAGDHWTWYEERPRVFLRSAKEQPFRLDLTLFTPRDHADNVAFAKQEAIRLASVPIAQTQKESEKWWKEFWSRSSIEFQDQELERIWYHNQYLLACCLRERKVAPGLFGNWTSGQIGTAWHGDYHMNYNTQQVFWGVFSSNHAEQHLPYVDLCEKLLPMSEAYARDKFGLPGAYFPHSAYPVPSQVFPYPAPPWGYEFCEVAWTVQSLWWHYLYTLDKDYLKRVYPLLRAATIFMVAYVKKESDGNYHIVPTVSPENWGFTVDFRLNRDCIMDLALTRFLLDAAIEASRVLNADEEQRGKWAEVAANLAPYPKAEGPYGEVWLDVLNAPVGWVYNIPVTLAPVFPGEQVGLGRREDQLDIARRTARTIRLEGGNDLVYQPLIRARLGMLDLEWFKREVRYCLVPNGVANDRVRQIDGRYKDSTDFDFMMRMGVWTENLSLPAVLNECLLQSFTGTIHLFPNTLGLNRARFRNLRAVNAFLVSASYDGKTVSEVSILSEKGAMARLLNPWPGSHVRVTRTKDKCEVGITWEGKVIRFPTEPGGLYTIKPVV